MVKLIIGIIIGMVLGIFAMAMAATATEADNQMEKIMQKSESDTY